MVDGAVIAHLNNKLELVGQNLHSMFDARFSRIETHLGMSPIGDDTHASTSNIDKTMDSSTGVGIPTNAVMINSAKQSSDRVNETTPRHKTLYNSTPHANVTPHGTSSSLRNISTPPNVAQPSSTPIANRLNADDVVSGSMKEEVIKIFR